MLGKAWRLLVVHGKVRRIETRYWVPWYLFQVLVPGRKLDSIKFCTRLGHRTLRQEETPLGDFTLVPQITSEPSGADKAFLFDGVNFQKWGQGSPVQSQCMKNMESYQTPLSENILPPGGAVCAATFSDWGLCDFSFFTCTRDYATKWVALNICNVCQSLWV